MKVIYSFADLQNPANINTNTLLIGLYSCIKLNEVYGESTIYTTPELIEKFKKFNFPFTNYISIEDKFEGYKTANLPKLYTYIQQTEPFIHIDLDLVLNKRLFINKNMPCQFGHLDINPKWRLDFLQTYKEAYIDPAAYFEDIYGVDFIKDICLHEIPNMGIVAVNDVDLFTRATKAALEVYYNHYNYFDSNFLSWCFLEQALIHKYLIQHSPTYEIAVNTGDAFLFEDTINVKMNDKFNIDKYDAPHFSGTEKYKTETLEYIIKKLDYRLGEKQLNYILENF